MSRRALFSRYSGVIFTLLPVLSGGNSGPREEARRKRSLATSPASKVRLSAGGRASHGTPGWRSLAFHSSVNLSGSDAWRVSVCGVRGRSKDGAGDDSGAGVDFSAARFRRLHPPTRAAPLPWTPSRCCCRQRLCDRGEQAPESKWTACCARGQSPTGCEDPRTSYYGTAESDRQIDILPEGRGRGS